MGRAPCCDRIEVNKGAWTQQEDEILKAFVEKHGPGKWKALPRKAGLARCGKSCRFRWMNYLRPNIKRGNFTRIEEETIINLHNEFGNRWSLIASRLPGRTDNEIKNVWHTHLKRRHENQQFARHHVRPINETSLIFSSTDTSSLELVEVNIDSKTPPVISLDNINTGEQSAMVQQYEEISDLFDGQRSAMKSMRSCNDGHFQGNDANNMGMFDSDVIDKQEKAWNLGYGSPSDNDEEDTMSFWISVYMNTNEYLDI